MKFFSMFSGIGGFEYGMEQSKHNFESVGWSEINKYASSIYSRHFPEHRNFGDATKIRTEELPDFDFLVGGFPCQSFSIAGNRQGFNDTRGTLFFEIARVLRDKTPRYFLLENVKNLLSHDGGRTVKKIFEVCDELGYDVSWKVYNSKDYGVPQNRERIFIKGYFREECGSEVLSLGEEKEKSSARINGKYVQNRSAYYYDSPDTLCACVTSTGQHSGGRNFVNVSDVDDRKIKKWGNFSPARHGGNNIFDVEGLCPTLVSWSVVKNGLNIVDKNNCDGNSVLPDEEYLIRRLTPIECERLQALPDDWTKYGKDGEVISDTQRYVCCGNTVTTTVVTAIVDEMFDGC